MRERWELRRRGLSGVAQSLLCRASLGLTLASSISYSSGGGELPVWALSTISLLLGELTITLLVGFSRLAEEEGLERAAASFVFGAFAGMIGFLAAWMYKGLFSGHSGWVVMLGGAWIGAMCVAISGRMITHRWHRKPEERVRYTDEEAMQILMQPVK